MENYEGNESKFPPIDKIVKDPENGGVPNIVMFEALVRKFRALWKAKVIDDTDTLLTMDGVKKGMKYQYHVLSYLKSYTQLSSSFKGIPIEYLPDVIKNFDFINMINKIPFYVVKNTGLEFKDDFGVSGVNLLADTYLTLIEFESRESNEYLVNVLGVDVSSIQQFNNLDISGLHGKLVLQHKYLIEYAYPKAQKVDPSLTFLQNTKPGKSLLPTYPRMIISLDIGSAYYATLPSIWWYSLPTMDLEKGIIELKADKDYPRYNFKKDQVVKVINLFDLYNKEKETNVKLNISTGLRKVFNELYELFLTIPGIKHYSGLYGALNDNNIKIVKHAKIVEVIKQDSTYQDYIQKLIDSFSTLRKRLEAEGAI